MPSPLHLRGGLFLLSNTAMSPLCRRRFSSWPRARIGPACCSHSSPHSTSRAWLAAVHSPPSPWRATRRSCPWHSTVAMSCSGAREPRRRQEFPPRHQGRRAPFPPLPAAVLAPHEPPRDRPRPAFHETDHDLNRCSPLGCHMDASQPAPADGHHVGAACVAALGERHPEEGQGGDHRARCGRDAAVHWPRDQGGEQRPQSRGRPLVRGRGGDAARLEPLRQREPRPAGMCPSPR